MGYQVFKASNWNFSMFRHEKNIKPKQTSKKLFLMCLCAFYGFQATFIWPKNIFSRPGSDGEPFSGMISQTLICIDLSPTTNANSLNLFLGGIWYFLDLDVGCSGWVCLCIWGFSWNIPTKSPADLQFHLIFVLRHSTLWQALSTVNIDIEDQTYKMHFMKSRLERYKC